MAAAEAPSASWVRTTPRGAPVEPLVATTARAVLDPLAPTKAGDGPVGPDDPGGSQGLEQRRGGGSGQAVVERGRRVPGVPDRTQHVDEAGPTGEVQCDEFGIGR